MTCMLLWILSFYSADLIKSVLQRDFEDHAFNALREACSAVLPSVHGPESDFKLRTRSLFQRPG